VRSILYVDHTAELGGAEVALIRLLAALDRTRFQPTVLLFSDGPLADRLREMAVEVQIVPLPSRLTKASRHRLASVLARPGDLVEGALHVKAVAAFMRRRRFDLVHTTSLKADIWGGLAARLAGRRLLWHVHDRIAEDYLPKMIVRLFRLLARWMPDVLMVNSRATLHTLPAVSPDRIKVVYPGVPAELLETGASSSKGTGRGDQAIVGIVGRLSPTKGQDVFVRAAAKIAGRFPDVRFQIIGGALFQHDGFEAEVRALAVSLGLQNVEFLGFCEDVPARMRALTILVHASPVPEPFGQVVVEALAAGKPVVATNAGGIPEIITDGDCGFLVPLGDPDALAEKICVLLADRDGAQAMGERGRARVAELFTAARMARNVEEFYDEVLARAD